MATVRGDLPLNDSGQPPHFGDIDRERPLSLDPQVWSDNLEALTRHQPELAETLAGVVLPSPWRAVYGLDETPTWRLEQPGEPPRWLGGTAAPGTRAAGLLDGLVVHGKNVALPRLGAGAELHHLLDQLPAHIAVFVFPENDATLAAVLHSRDFSGALACGRCYFLRPDNAEVALQQLLTTLPGLLPPGEILVPCLTTPEHITTLQALGMRISRQIAEQRAANLATITPRAITPVMDRPRLALFSLRPSIHAPYLHALAEHATTLGWHITPAIVTDPRTVDVTSHCAAVLADTPEVTVCVEHGPELFPRPLPGMPFIWHLESPPPNSVPDSNVYLAASPRIVAALQQAGVTPSQVTPWYWACDPAWSKLQPAQPKEVVLFLGDLPAETPETYGLRNSAHQRLWEAITADIAQQWQSPQLLPVGGLLVAAERRTGLRIDDDGLRTALLQLIEDRLIPAVLQVTLVRACLRGGLRVAAVGRGWERLAGAELKIVAKHASSLGAQRAFAPRVCVAAGRLDPLGPELLLAAARGWPLLIQRLGGVSYSSMLGEVLTPDVHFAPFNTLSEFQEALQWVWDGSPQVRQRADRTRQHVAAKHSFTQRLECLAEVLRSIRAGS